MPGHPSSITTIVYNVQPKNPATFRCLCLGKTALTHPTRCGHHVRVRKLFRESENTSRQGAAWPKLAGCVVALMLLALTVAARPQLDPTNPTSFFTNVAMAMFQQMDLHDFNGNLVTITNIPLYEDPAQFGGTNINYYTPAVHRILQLAANIFDATTNRFIDGGPTNYPTVFRPIFGSQNGIVTIIGYQEVTSPTEAFLPMLNASDFIKVSQPVNSSFNLYGVPWVIGAKKGFPNFNQFSMENALTVSRRLQFTNAAAHPPWTTNQFYTLYLTNTFGIGAWNSYTNTYGRNLRLVVSNEMSIAVTDETGFPLLAATNITGSDINLSSWQGWNVKTLDPQSMKVPLYQSSAYTNGIYGNTFAHPLNPPRWDITFVPRLWMILQLKVKFVLIDTTAQRVIDYVNLFSVAPPVDITSNLQVNLSNPGQPWTFPDESDVNAQWDTNLFRGIQKGLLNQILVSIDGGQGSLWIDPNKQTRINNFLVNLSGGTNTFLAPFSPTAAIYQRISWQANDPLVHYTIPDLTSTNGFVVFLNQVALFPHASLTNYLFQLNFAYQPWGGCHVPYGTSLNPSVSDFDVRVKDPGVQQSDDWNFPSGESLSFEWLGRVHRGTPWQTVFLKSSNQTVGQWLTWNNDNILIPNGNLVSLDAAFSHPNNDWHFASLWAQWLNTNDLSTLLSINNTDTNAWAARLDGLTALTNSTPSELDPITITSNSPQAGIIAQAIQTARATNQTFQDVGDVLATLQLSIASPFLNFVLVGVNKFTANGVTDEAFEKIPTQLLPLLRVDSFGKIVPANGQLAMSFSGYDGHAYAIEASSNLTDWVILSTNFPSDGNFGITNTTTSGQQFYRSVLLH
jgi:hypothetical protein